MTRQKGAAAFDGWTLVHVAAGGALGVAGLGWLWAAAMIVGFEVVEAGLRRIKVKEGGGLFEYESWPNIVADIVVGLAGYAVAFLLMPRGGLLGML